MNPCANCGKTWDVPCDARCPSPRFASEFDRIEWLARALVAAQEREREEAVSGLYVAYRARLRAQSAYIEATSAQVALGLVARLRAAEAILANELDADDLAHGTNKTRRLFLAWRDAGGGS